MENQEANNKVSVIMGIYNCEETLAEAIDSIINQTYTDWQLIMCDDCSTDGTYRLAEEYRERYPDRIILLKNEKNMRLSYSLNRCIEAADGRFVARMDGDDISAPDRFEKQVRYLEAHPDVQLVGTAMQRFDEKGLHDVDGKPEHPDRFILRNDKPFNHATIMTYRHVYDTLGGYTVSERTKRSQDYELWFRFYHAGFSGDNLPDALYLVREDENAIKRRTFRVRRNSYLIMVNGYRLLGFPKRWLIKPTIMFIIKSLVPFKLQYKYRQWQQRRSKAGG